MNWARAGKYGKWFLVFWGVVAIIDWFVVPVFLGLPILTRWR